MNNYNSPTDIRQLRLYLQNIFTNGRLTDQEKYNKTYEAVFDRRTLIHGKQVYYMENGHGGLYTETEKWEWLFQRDKDCVKFIDEAKYHVPPNLILNKYQKVMDDQKIDITAVTQLEKRILCIAGQEENFYCFVAPHNANWLLCRDYMDEYIKLPDVPNCRYMLYNEYSDYPLYNTYSAERTEKFLRALKERGEDYILKFMLIVMLRPSGDLFNFLDATGGYYRYRDLYNYARPVQVRDFPYWYQAWNRLVTTMCQRFESFSSVITSEPNPPQKACGDLIHAQKYRVTQEKADRLHMEPPYDSGIY